MKSIKSQAGFADAFSGVMGILTIAAISIHLAFATPEKASEAQLIEVAQLVEKAKAIPDSEAFLQNVTLSTKHGLKAEDVETIKRQYAELALKDSLKSTKDA